ncbi:CcdC protein domain-containing protein [Terrilactibacillus laevilacticus]|uniref:CcdC protein domain-containing protein n=1 Tax=Terrilactibacillus laevilacticus TaxID=1380157 RepID=A0ABW5PN17_9BACI|nr:CcdC protein domain-containing protein [Terrilactibacillus laevilacticus]
MFQQSYVVIIIVGLILFSIFRRIRRNIGWQPLNARKLLLRTIMFGIIGLVFFSESIFHPVIIISDVSGIVIGMILSYYSMVVTRFEQREGQWFYFPSTWIGSFVIAIFFGRMIYRVYQLFEMKGTISQINGVEAKDLQRYYMGDSWAAGILLIIFSYYISYYIHLLRKQKRLSQVGELLD